MSKIVKEITYKSIDDFLNETTSINGGLFKEFFSCSGSSVSHQYVFRGESSFNNKLIPRCLRIGTENSFSSKFGAPTQKHYFKSEFDQIECEDKILKKFYERCDYAGLKIPTIEKLRYHSLSSSDILSNKFWLPDDYFELAALAQHYGLPTRLLDWTSNFLVAIYFAIKKAEIHDEYCSIWAFKYTSITNHFNDQQDRPRIIIPEYANNPNLQAQKGLFTHWQKFFIKQDFMSRPVDRSSLEVLIEESNYDNLEVDNLFYKLNIPIRLSKDLYFYLSSMGFDAATLFPGYSGIVMSLEEDERFLKNACP